MLDWLVKRNIAPHIPVIDKSGRTDGTWSHPDFERDAENNQYIHPQGEALKQFRRSYSDPNRGQTGKGVAKYQALKHTCQAYPSKLRKKIEMLFAHLKRIFGLGRLRLRGLCGANDEFLLAAAQNLRKSAKIFPAPQQTRKA